MLAYCGIRRRAAAPPRKAAGGCRGGGWQGGACRWLSLPQGARGAPRF